MTDKMNIQRDKEGYTYKTASPMFVSRERHPAQVCVHLLGILLGVSSSCLPSAIT